MPDGHFVFAIVAEDRMCFENATLVGDAIGSELTHQHWNDEELFARSRIWVGHPSNEGLEPFLPTKELTRVFAKGWGSSRRFHGQHGPEALRVAKAIAAFDSLKQSVLVIALDIDRKLERLEGLIASADSTVVIAAMNPEAEAWRIVLYQPIPSDTHTALVSELSFDPVREPERTRSTDSNAGLRDTKYCHDRLYPRGDSVESLTKPLDILRNTPASCGLPDYIKDFTAALKACEPSFQRPSK
jgi:hypothetical protein